MMLIPSKKYGTSILSLTFKNIYYYVRYLWSWAGAWGNAR
jgi:hypothetical protein